jgi:hypothetical protein
MPRGFLLSTLSYTFDYESACVLLVLHDEHGSHNFHSHMYTQSEGILSIVLGRISCHSLNSIFSYPKPPPQYCSSGEITPH